MRTEGLGAQPLVASCKYLMQLDTNILGNINIKHQLKIEVHKWLKKITEKSESDFSLSDEN